MTSGQMNSPVLPDYLRINIRSSYVSHNGCNKVLPTLTIFKRQMLFKGKVSETRGTTYFAVNYWLIADSSHLRHPEVLFSPYGHFAGLEKAKLLTTYP